MPVPGGLKKIRIFKHKRTKKNLDHLSKGQKKTKKQARSRSPRSRKKDHQLWCGCSRESTLAADLSGRTEAHPRVLDGELLRRDLD